MRRKQNDLFHLSDDEKNMGGQQFNNYWDEIAQLLTDFGYNVNMLEGLKTDDHLNKEHEKRLDQIDGRVE